MRQRRERIIRLVKRRLLRKGRPRLVVSLILLATGLAGFLVSFLLLRSGMTRMWLRYPLAILFAYCVFLLLLRLWLALLQKRNDKLMDDGLSLDFPDPSSLDINLPDSTGHSGGFSFSGGGGDAAGGGAGGSWGQGVLSSSSPAGAGGGGVSSSSGGDASSGGGVVVAAASMWT
jgi:uncharacterized membrane protein YgcG